MQNYFNYFTEIEERYLQRRGGGLLLSTLDWALIEMWKNAGIPLEAALRGIDAAFDRYEQRPSKTKKVNSLAYCSQEVLAAAEDMKEAAVGAGSSPHTSAVKGYEPEFVIAYLNKNADIIAGSQATSAVAQTVIQESANALREIASGIRQKPSLRLEDLERRLTMMEEKIMAALLTTTPDSEIVSIRAEAERELAPYRSKMSGAQIDQLLKQYLQKHLLRKYQLPRLSLFYME